MKKPISSRAEKLIEDPRKRKWLMEYLNSPEKRNKDILLVAEINDNLGIYKVNEDNEVIDIDGIIVGHKNASNGEVIWTEDKAAIMV